MGTYLPSTAHAGLAQMVQNNISVGWGDSYPLVCILVSLLLLGYDLVSYRKRAPWTPVRARGHSPPASVSSLGPGTILTASTTPHRRGLSKRRQRGSRRQLRREGVETFSFQED